MSIRALVIGIDNYLDARITRLQCAGKDAEKIAGLVDGMGALTELLLNSRATSVGIRRALASLARAASPEDTAIVYYSGHGARESVQLRDSQPKVIPVIVPYDAVEDDLLATAIPMDDFGQYLEMIRSRNVLFFFDSCYSGAVTGARTFALGGRRAVERGAPVLPSIAGKGTVVLSASQEYEPAYEDPAVGHGVFTEFLIDALTGSAKVNEEGRIGLEAIFAHLQSKIPEKTRRLYKQTQTPTQHGSLEENITFPLVKGTPHRTLVGFPYRFLPLTIVVGDRREQEPKTAGDLFALSASPAELRWIFKLGLPQDTDIVSDKVIRNADRNYLCKTFGHRNLLVVGSPACNHLARIVNETAFFPFDVDGAVRAQLKTMNGEIDQFGSDRTKLMNYAFDPRNREGFRFYMNQFKRGGFIDPTYSYLRRGDHIPHDKDYGVVTLCRNPFTEKSSGDYVAILAAGVHLPGTMHSVAMLGEAKDEFRERPMGGVFNVALSEKDWEKRLSVASPSWSTEPYSLNDLKTSLVHLKERLAELRGWTEDDVDGRSHLLQMLMNG